MVCLGCFLHPLWHVPAARGQPLCLESKLQVAVPAALQALGELVALASRQMAVPTVRKKHLSPLVAPSQVSHSRALSFWRGGHCPPDSAPEWAGCGPSLSISEGGHASSLQGPWCVWCLVSICLTSWSVALPEVCGPNLYQMSRILEPSALCSHVSYIQDYVNSGFVLPHVAPRMF